MSEEAAGATGGFWYFGASRLCNRQRPKPSARLVVSSTWIAYMWTAEQLEIDIEQADESTLILAISTPAGMVTMIGTFELAGDVLRVDGAHIDGPGVGRLGRSGLNAIGRKILEEANVEEIIVQGSVRTTGRNPGRPPRTFRFPNRRRDPGG